MRLPTEEAFRKYADRVFAAAYSVCRDRTDADDVVQDVFLRYHSPARDYRDDDHLRAWLLRAAINRSRDLRRAFWRRNRVAWTEDLAALAFPEPEDSLLFEAVMALPEKYRLALHLFYYEAYDLREIAQLLDCREGTVKSWLSRGRARLRNQRTEGWDDDE